MKKYPILRKNQQIFQITTQKSSYQFEKTAQFYQPSQNSIINKRYNEYERKPSQKQQITSHPSTSDTQQPKGTACSSLQTSQQNSPLRQPENLKKSTPQKYISTYGNPFKEGTNNQLQLIKVQQKSQNSIVLKPSNQIENSFVVNLQKSGGKILSLIKEPPEVSFGEEGAPQFNMELQLLRRSGRKFHVRPSDLDKIVKEQQITRTFKTTQDSPPQSATLQTMQKVRPIDYFSKNSLQNELIRTGTVSRSHSPRIQDNQQRASPLPDIFMTAAVIIIQKKKNYQKMKRPTPIKGKSNHPNVMTSENTRQSIQQNIPSDFRNTLSQMDFDLFNRKLFNEEDIPTKHARIQSVTDTKQPLIRLPVLESSQSIRSKSFLQRKAQIKIINRIFSGKSQS